MNGRRRRRAETVARGKKETSPVPTIGWRPVSVYAGGGGGIRILVTLYRPNGFRDRRIQPLCHPSAWGETTRRLEASASREKQLAESQGFEPWRRFWRLHDFQSCSFGHSDNSPCSAQEIVPYLSDNANGDFVQLVQAWGRGRRYRLVDARRRAGRWQRSARASRFC